MRCRGLKGDQVIAAVANENEVSLPALVRSYNGKPAIITRSGFLVHGRDAPLDSDDTALVARYAVHHMCIDAYRHVRRRRKDLVEAVERSTGMSLHVR